MKRALTTLVLAALLGSAFAAGDAVAAPQSAAAADAALYVAPGGDDSASGAIDAPLATLEGARDRIRSLKSSGSLPGGGMTVYLRQGTYQRDASFELTAEDSGTKDAPITYRSYPGERATLSGGRTLPKDDFHGVTDTAVRDRIIDAPARDKVQQIDLRALGLTDYGQLSRHGYWKANDVSLTPPMELYIEGQGMTLARWPNADAAKPTVQMGDIVDPGPTRKDADLQDRGGTFTYGYDRPKYWTQATDVWLDGIFGYSWEWSYNKIQSIDTEKKTITLRYGEMSGIMKSWFPDFHFAQNLLEELDAPGEYYIDRDKGVLYLIPNAAFTAGRGDITVTTLKEPMLRTDGTSYVTFDDLALEYGRATAAVILGGSHVTVSHSDIRNFTDGGVLINSPGRYTYDGIPVNRGGTDHAVTDSRITHVGGIGVVLQGGDKKTLAPGRNRVQNSEIADFAYYHKAYNPGVMFDGVGNIARGNKIHDAPHPGIIVYGNDHLFERNEVYDVCKQFHDLGAIYMNSGQTPQQRGHVFTENYFHDIGVGMAGVEGIYADNFTWDLTITKNIFVNMGNSGIKSGSADYIEARNNIFIDNLVPYDNYEQWMGNQEGNVVDRDYMPVWKKVFADNNDFVGTPYLEKYPELAHFFQDDHYFPNHSTFAQNVVWNPNRKPSGLNAQGAKDGKNLLNYETNMVATSDPGFVDAAHGDYRLKADAAVFTQIPGFQDIAFDKIGVQGRIGQSQSPEKVALEGIAFPSDAVRVDVGHDVRASAVPLPWNAADAKVTYASADPTIATVAADGTITGAGPGTTTITAKAAANAAFTSTISVTVDEGDGVLHFTDFESGANGWPTDPNRSIALNGSDHVYRVVKGANGVLPRDFTSFVLDVDVTTPAGDAATGSGFLIYDRNGKGGGYIRYRNAAAGPTWTIFDDAWKVVAEKVLPGGKALPPGMTSHVRAAVQDGRIRISVGGELVLDGADPAPGAAGRVGFYVEGYPSLDFDDIGFSISAVPVTGVTLDTSAAAMNVGERRTVTAKVAPEDASDLRVGWTSADPSVATVDAAGRIAAVGPGSTTITAASVAEPTATAAVAVTVTDAAYPTTRLDAQLKDAANWTSSSVIAVDDSGVKITGQGVHGYKAERFGDGLLQFVADFGAFDGGWYGFQVRSDQTGIPAWQNSNTGYLVIVKEDTFEFQSWSPGQTMLDIIPNTVIAPNSTHRIEVGAVKETGGTRVVLRVDGKTIWNTLDARQNLRIGADGFLNLYHYAKTNTLTVRPTPTVSSIAWAAESKPKTAYLVGEQLDVTGMMLEVTWSDGTKTTRPVDAAMVTGFDSRKVSPHQRLTVKVDGASTELTVSIRNKLKG